MHVTFTPGELALRNQVRAFFRDEYPDDIREAVDSGAEMSPDMQTRWQKALHEKGCSGVSWHLDHISTG